MEWIRVWRKPHSGWCSGCVFTFTFLFFTTSILLYIVYSFSVTCFQAFLNVDENKVLQVFAKADPRFCTKYVFRFLHVAFLAVKLQNFALSLVHFFAIALIALTSKCGLRYQKGFLSLWLKSMSACSSVLMHMIAFCVIQTWIWAANRVFSASARLSWDSRWLRVDSRILESSSVVFTLSCNDRGKQRMSGRDH